MAAAAQVIDVKVPEAYSPLWDDSYSVYVVHGGRGSGKSWAVADRLAVRGTESRRRIFGAREFQNSIEDSSKALLEDRIAALGLPGWQPLQTELRCLNGSYVRFVGLRTNPDSVKSKEAITDMWIEEANRLSMPTITKLMPTLGRVGAPKLYLTFNLESEDSPVFREFILNPQPNSVIIKTTYRDNPHFPPYLKLQMERMRRIDPELAAHVWDGEPLTISKAQIFAGRWSVDTFEPGAESDGWRGPFYGADFGFAADPNVLVETWIRENILYIAKEAFGWKVENSELPALYRKIRPDIAAWPIRADSARPETISYLNHECGMNVQGVKKWQGSVEDGIAFMRSFDKIVIHPSCKHMEEAMKGYSFKVNKDTGDVLPIPLHAYSDGPDAVRYSLEPMIRKRQAWGVS